MGFDIFKFFENKTILVTGATGFLAKVALEKIIRIQPNVKKIYLLIRAADTNSAVKRFHQEVLGTKLFEALRERSGENFLELIMEKVIPVVGDVSFEDLGVFDLELQKEMWREIDIIFNSAATTRFDERYDVALAINTFGIGHLMNFTKKCAHMEMLLHISTAYVCGKTNDKIISEKSFRMGEALNGSHDLDISREKQMADELLIQLRANSASDKEITRALRELGLQRARVYGWPNTYAFTKAMGEMLLEHHRSENFPIVIVRPPIITSTYEEPFPGWIENVRTFDWIIAAYAKGMLKFFVANPETVLDVCPVDMVVNGIILAMTLHSNNQNQSHRAGHLMIYHVGSSSINPFRVADLHDLMYRYLKGHPWMDENGMPVKVARLTLFKTMDSFRNYITFRYSPLLKALRFVNSISCGRLDRLYVDLNRKVNAVKRLAEIYEPYSFFKSSFNNSNMEALRTIAKENGVDFNVFNSDPRCINWEDYMMKVHFPGIIRALKS